MGGNGGCGSNPAHLEHAANILASAAAHDERAARQLGFGVLDAAAFGPSPQAHDLAAKWNLAVRSRVEEADYLAARTGELAEELRRTADEYRAAENGNTHRFDGPAAELAH